MRNKLQCAFGAIGVLIVIQVVGITGQSRALPQDDVLSIYRRLLAQIEQIRIFDHHAHPGFGDDPDVDAQATPPQHLPRRARETNPELIIAVKTLFDHPYSDLA